MTTRLRSLRVTSEMDSSGYARGAQAKVAADSAMISSGDRFGASLANTDMQLQKLPAGMARLSRMWLGGYSEAEKFEKAVRQVGNAIDHGMDLDRAVTMLKAIETQFGRTANAAQLAKQGFVSVGAPLATAHIDQSGLNSLLGSGGSGKSAQDSAAIFQAAAVEQERMAISAKALRAEIDPLGTAQARLNAELMEYRTQAGAGVISTQELGMAQQMATTRFGTLAQNMAATAKQGGLARHQVANLSYQLNDVAVMLASGQAPFMLFMQQGMQIGQLLGPQGLQSGVKSLGAGIASFLTNPVNLAVMGFAGLAAGAAYAFRVITDQGDSVEETLKKQKDILSGIKDAYGEIAAGSQKLAPNSSAVIQFEARINFDEMRRAMEKQLQQSVTVGIESGFKAEAIDPKKYGDPLRNMFRDFAREAEKGKGNIIEFRDSVARFANLDPENSAIQKSASDLILWSDAVAGAKRQADAALLSIDPLMQKMRHRLAFTDPLMGQKPAEASLYSMIPDNRGQMERLEASYKQLVQNATGMGQVAQATTLYQQALDSLNAELGKTVALNELDIRSIYAKSPGQKAEIAAQRERINAINTGVKGTELDIRVQHASAQAYQEATFAIAEQNKARLQAANDNVANARLEFDLIGAGAAAQAEARANLASYLELKRQAEANGLGFDQSYYELLKGQNHELALLVELTARKKLATDIGNDRRFMGMSGREGDIQKELLGYGIEQGTEAWRNYHDQLLAIKETQDSVMFGVKGGFDEIRADANDFAGSAKDLVTDLYGGMEDAFVSFSKTGKLNFKSLIDTMMDDMARLSFKMATSGLLNQLGGGSPTNTSGYGGMLGSMFGSLFKAPSLYAKGDIFDKPTAFRHGAGQMGVMGEAGPEAVVPLKKSRDGSLGVTMTGGGSSGGLSVVINNGVGARIETREERDPRGDRKLIIDMIDQRINYQISNPYSLASPALNARGAKPARVMR